MIPFEVAVKKNKKSIKLMLKVRTMTFHSSVHKHFIKSFNSGLYWLIAVLIIYPNPELSWVTNNPVVCRTVVISICCYNSSEFRRIIFATTITVSECYLFVSLDTAVRDTQFIYTSCCFWRNYIALHNCHSFIAEHLIFSMNIYKDTWSNFT